MKTINIKGKPYVMVKDRVIYFNENYPNGCITTDILSSSEDKYIIKAVVTPDMKNPERYFTGHAEEVIGSSMINKTSALENAESSAIGRCLGMMGIGIEDSIASAEEVLQAQAKQNNTNFKKSDDQLGKFDSLIRSKYFDGKRSDIKKRWNVISTFSQTEVFLSQMNQRVTDFNNGIIEQGEA